MRVIVERDGKWKQIPLEEFERDNGIVQVSIQLMVFQYHYLSV